jgi:hypothetical protein
MHSAMATTGNNGTIPLPNPFTPLAFLPPALADKYQVVIYVYVATMAVSNLFRIFFGRLSLATGVHMGLVNVHPGRD